jgi:hypothetical protein
MAMNNQGITPQNLPGGTEKNHENLSQDIRCSNGDSKRALLEQLVLQYQLNVA